MLDVPSPPAAPARTPERARRVYRRYPANWDSLTEGRSWSWPIRWLLNSNASCAAGWSHAEEDTFQLTEHGHA